MSIHNNKRYENEFVKLMKNKGFHCERVAGSGKGGVCDCVLFKDGEVFLVEVKATKEPKFYLRKTVKQQLEIMIKIAHKSNVGALLAIKYKGKGWGIKRTKTRNKY